jgi:hypothetical protein
MNHTGEIINRVLDLGKKPATIIIEAFTCDFYSHQKIRHER